MRSGGFRFVRIEDQVRMIQTLFPSLVRSRFGSPVNLNETSTFIYKQQTMLVTGYY